jgi:ubiquinone/menaquinone biosynthesis C-methylase UbiE
MRASGNSALNTSITPVADDVRRLKDALRETYSRGAEVYDAERSITPKVRRFFARAYDTVDELLGPLDASAIQVDMPVGTGRLLCHLHARGRRHRMFGIDIAPGMLSVCRQSTNVQGMNVSLSFGDAFRLPLADNSIDVLTSLRFFHLFPNHLWPDLLAEMHRVLRPGGFVLAEFRNRFRAGPGGIIKEYRDRWMRGDQAHAFIAPGAARRLFRQWDRIAVCGAGLDGVSALERVVPAITNRIERCARSAPWCYLTKELLIKAWKARG